MKFKSTKLNPGGSITAELADGVRITANAKGSTILELDKLRTAGIRQLADVESHTVNNVMGSISHYVRFHGGGEVKYAYSQITGKLIALSVENASVRVSKDGSEVLFSRMPADRPATGHWRRRAMNWLIWKAVNLLRTLSRIRRSAGN